MSIVMHLCVCLYVCRSMRKNLDLYETPMYFRSFVLFVNYFVIICILGEICISLSILVKKFQLLRGFTKLVL